MAYCDYCPAAWEDSTNNENGYECEAYGCKIYGLYRASEGDSCGLSAKEVEKRLQQLKDYEAGKIKRPQWVANKFLRELDSQMSEVKCGLPGYPPVWMRNGCYMSLQAETDIYYTQTHAYRDGYEDAKAGKECDPHSRYCPVKQETKAEDLFE